MTNNIDYATVITLCLKRGWHTPAVLKELAKGTTMDEISKKYDDGPTRAQKKMESQFFISSTRLRQFRCNVLEQSQVEHAEMLTAITGKSYSPLTVSAVENGNRMYKVSTMIILAKLSSSSLDYLLGRSDYKMPYNPPCTERTMAERIKFLMKYTGYTEKNLQEYIVKCGCKKPNLKNPSIRQIMYLADLFNTSADFIAGLTDNIAYN